MTNFLILVERQKVFITFLILKNHIELLKQEYPQHWKYFLIEALEDNSKQKLILQFVSTGGGLFFKNDTRGDEFHAFRQKNQVWYNNRQDKNYLVFILLLTIATILNQYVYKWRLSQMIQLMLYFITSQELQKICRNTNLKYFGSTQKTKLE